jgi:hypothetical protein
MRLTDNYSTVVSVSEEKIKAGEMPFVYANGSNRISFHNLTSASKCLNPYIYIILYLAFR